MIVTHPKLANLRRVEAAQSHSEVRMNLIVAVTPDCGRRTTEAPR